MKKSFLFYLISFFYFLILIYTPHIHGVPSIYLITILSLFLLIIKRIYLSYHSIFFIITISLITILSQSVNGVLSREACFQLIKFLSIYINLLFFYQFVCKRCYMKLFKILGFALLTNSLIIILCVHLDGFQDFIGNFITYTAKQYRYHSFETSFVTRYSGLSPSGFSYLSTYTALLTIIFLHYSKCNSIKKIFILLISLYSIIFIGRTGLILLLTYLLITRFKMSIIFLSFGILTLSDLSVLSKHFIHAFEFFHYGTKIYSIDILLTNELFLPELKLFGHGTITRYEGGPNSDIGFIKYLHFMGPYLLFITFLLFYLFINQKCTSFSFIHHFIYICIILINFKDFYFLSTGYSQAFIFLTFVSNRNNA